MNEPILTDLSRTPDINDIFYWCDYIEIFCLACLDKEVYIDNLVEIKQEMIDTQMGAELFEEDEYRDALISESMTNDRQVLAMRDRFRHLSFRASIFGDSLYPFNIEDECLSLKENLTKWHFLYIQLLLSSLLRYIPKKRRHQLTEPFEKISLAIFKSLMPQGWQVHSFGKQQSQRYNGHIYDKFVKLAEDIRGRVVATRADFNKRDYGDGGVDIVAWHPMEDDRPLIPAAIAQCGCTSKDFSSKMMEGTPAKLATCMHTSHPWASYYFMPQAMHDESGWLRYSDMGGVIVVDRIRIMKLMHLYNTNIDILIDEGMVMEAKELAIS